MIKKTLSYLQLKEVGFLEILVALYPILSGYSYGSIHGNILFIFIIALIALFKQKQKFSTFWLICLIAFVCIHELLLIMIIPVSSYFINNTVSVFFISICIIPISKAINYNKLVGSLNWVSIFAIGGIIYQFMIVMSGGDVSPIKMPFMPDMDINSRLFEQRMRPSSFFWEPATFVTFLMVPLIISLVQKKYLWTGIIILSMFLSTSSTGILMSFIMLVVYLLTQKNKLRTRMFVIVFGVGLSYILLNSSYFEMGVGKIENTDIEQNTRLMNGVFLYESLSPLEKLFGIEAANVDDYCKQNNIFYFGSTKIFVPTFWLTLAKYGVFGVLLLLLLYISLIRKDKSLFPYIIVLLIAMFFQGIGVGSNIFAYQLIFLYSYVNRNNIKSDKK